MIAGSAPPPDGGWRDAPLLAAVTAHRLLGHPGEALGCGECRDQVDDALKAAFERLPPVKLPGGLFPM